MAVDYQTGGGGDDGGDDDPSTTPITENPWAGDPTEDGAEDPASEYEYTGDMAGDSWDSTAVVDEEPTSFWNPPDSLSGPDTPNETAEDMLVEEYDWDRESADEAVPDGFYDTVSRAGGGLSDGASDAADAAGDAAEDLTEMFPWYTEYAVAGAVVLVLMVMLAPYAELGAEVAG